MHDLVIAFILLAWAGLGGLLAGWLLTRKKKPWHKYEWIVIALLLAWVIYLFIIK